jgi:ribosomal protein S18 acetylase RimI-like enzyme
VIAGLLQRRGSGPPRLLFDGNVAARVRRWPGRPDIAHLILADHTIGPSVTGLHDWIRTLHACDFPIIRTGAVSQDVARQFLDSGFHVIQELALLQLDDREELQRLRRARAPLYELRPLRSVRSLHFAAEIDGSAFDPGWELDATNIREACLATPQHRIRLALTATEDPVGYMITGRSGSTGFIQRLAVEREHQGLGVASALLQDGLAWLARHRVTSVLVNTHLDNDRALSLYRRWGFHLLDQRLLVLEHVGSRGGESPSDRS